MKLASKSKKDALAALDEVNKEYKQVCSNLKKKYAELDKAADNAITLISNVENLIESIRHRPWSYKAIKKKIAVTKNTQTPFPLDKAFCNFSRLSPKAQPLALAKSKYTDIKLFIK